MGMVGRVGRWEGREGGERKDDPEATCYLVQQQLEIECDFSYRCQAYMFWTELAIFFLLREHAHCTHLYIQHTQSLSKELEK